VDNHSVSIAAVKNTGDAANFKNSIVAG